MAAASASAFVKQQRVSLALSSDPSPHIFPAQSFRDDTGLGVHSPDSAQAPDDAADAKKGKVHRIAGRDDAPDTGDLTTHMLVGMSDGSCGHQPPSTMNSEKPEKKPRKKWTMEETQMLVAGCNKVRGVVVSGTRCARSNYYWCIVVATVGYH